MDILPLSTTFSENKYLFVMEERKDMKKRVLGRKRKVKKNSWRRNRKKKGKRRRRN